VLGSVPKGQAGTAGGALITAQRIGAAIGIAIIGTALFGSGSGQSSSARLMPSLTHGPDGDGAEPGVRPGGVAVRVRPAQEPVRGTSREEYMTTWRVSAPGEQDAAAGSR